MSYEVRINKQARDDLRSIYSYIAFHLQEPRVALRQYTKIKNSLLTLSEKPERHPLYADEPWRGMGLRRMVIGSYIAFYWVDDAESAVWVVRVMFGGRDANQQMETMSLS